MASQLGPENSVLVTGASGFIGSNLVRALVDKGYKVTSLGRAGRAPKNLRDLDIEHVSCDITNKEQVNESLKGFDIIFHLAGLVSYKTKDVQRQYAVNVIGTKNIMEAALRHKAKRVIHTSSIAAMGLPKENEIGTEDLSYNLGGKGLNYCDSKYAAEYEVRESWRNGLPALILSPGITLGEGDTHSHHHAIIKAMAGKSVVYVPPGGVTFSDIKDVIDAHISSITKGTTGERYSIVSDNLTYQDAAKKWCQVFGRSAKIVVVPGWLLMGLSTVAEKWMSLLKKESKVSTQQAWLAQHKIFFSSEKAIKELDFRPTKFEDTIKRTAKYYLGQDPN